MGFYQQTSRAWEGLGLPGAATRLLFLSAASFLERQVNEGAAGHVVIGQGVGVLDEDALRGGEMGKKKKNKNTQKKIQKVIIAETLEPLPTTARRSENGSGAGNAL